MKNKTFEDINEKYELEIERLVETIGKERSKRILLQFPDGIKPYATAILEEIELRLAREKLNCEILLWFDSCFGACDVPLEVGRLGVDLIVQFGHSAWPYSDEVSTVD